MIIFFFHFCTGLLTVAPGMRCGMNFNDSKKISDVKISTEQQTPQSVINLADILAQDMDDLDLGLGETEEVEEAEEQVQVGCVG